MNSLTDLKKFIMENFKNIMIKSFNGWQLVTQPASNSNLYTKDGILYELDTHGFSKNGVTFTSEKALRTDLATQNSDVTRFKKPEPISEQEFREALGDPSNFVTEEAFIEEINAPPMTLRKTRGGIRYSTESAKIDAHLGCLKNDLKFSSSKLRAIERKMFEDASQTTQTKERKKRMPNVQAAQRKRSEVVKQVRVVKPRAVAGAVKKPVSNKSPVKKSQVLLLTKKKPAVAKKKIPVVTKKKKKVTVVAKKKRNVK